MLPICLLVHAAMLGISAYVHSPMTDEIAHVAAGLGHWYFGDFELYNVNPPLPRVIGTLPLYLGMSLDGNYLVEIYSRVGVVSDARGLVLSLRKEFAIGDTLLSHVGSKYFFWLMIARWTCIPFSCLGAWVCFTWAAELYGLKAGMIALLLWCTSPLVLAFGGALTPDVPSAAMGVFALYRYWKWTRNATYANAYLAGLSVGLAELTRSTWIFLHPFLFLLNLGICYSRGNLFTTANQSLVQFLVAWIVLLGGYGFSDQFKPLGDFEFSSPSLQIREYSKSGELESVCNRFKDSWMGRIPVPLPTEFVRGVDVQEAAMVSQTSIGFLCGEGRLGGWWYYYFVVLLLKCTISEIGLFIIATLGVLLFSLVSHKSSKQSHLTLSGTGKHRFISIETALLLGPIVICLGLLSVHFGLNRHARYMLQFFPLCFVWSSQSVTFFTRQPWLRFATIVVATAGSISSLFYFPHSLSYFNELIGGPSQGHRYLSGTNIDWGHDVFYLRDELKKRGWDSVGILLWARYDLRLAGIRAEIKSIPNSNHWQDDVNFTTEKCSDALSPGRYAVSVCVVQGTIPNPNDRRKEDPLESGYTYFQEFNPIGRVGYSIWLYDLSEEDILNSKTWGTIYRRCSIEKSIEVDSPKPDSLQDPPADALAPR